VAMATMLRMRVISLARYILQAYCSGINRS
jgi:hypothetical protein